MTKQPAIIDAEFEVVEPKRSLMPAVKHYATMLAIGALLACSMVGFFCGVLWISILLYQLFWSIVGAFVAVFGGLIIFTWAASTGAEINRRWKRR